MNPHDQALEDARRAGFDLSMLESNLALPPRKGGASTVSPWKWRWSFNKRE